MILRRSRLRTRLATVNARLKSWSSWARLRHGPSRDIDLFDLSENLSFPDYHRIEA